MGVVLRTHPVCGESHIQRNASGEVATLPTAKALLGLLFCHSNHIQLVT